MTYFKAYIQRGNITESVHTAKCLVRDKNYKDILSTGNINSLVYPRSSIKIFQALPFILSGANKKFKLNNKILAISCSSHCGEKKHLDVLKLWIKKIDFTISALQCGIHNPINAEASKKVFLSGKKPNQLHNNCSGKHLAMVSGCLSFNMDVKNYIDFNHPYQKMIRESLEYFTNVSIKKSWYGLDGCSAPQYAFPIKSLANAMINLIKENTAKSKYGLASSILLKSIIKNPNLIGGTNRFDSEIIKISKGRIFCKGGAEGVLLFADHKKKIGGIIKINDGNERAIPPIAIKVFKKLRLLNKNEIKNLQKWEEFAICNHSQKKIGKIVPYL